MDYVEQFGESGRDAALLSLRIFALSDREQERVGNFVSDAEKRDTDKDAADTYALIERFVVWLRDYQNGVPMHDSCRLNSLTGAQYEQFLQAYRLILEAGK